MNLFSGKIAALTLLASVAASPVLAQENQLMAVRVATPDVATAKASAAFYTQLLGLQEIARMERAIDPDFIEVIMNFGATPEAAKTAKTPMVVLTTASKGTAFPHPTPNLIFRVPNVDDTLKQTVAAGGQVQRAPSPGPGPLVAFVLDPAGNSVELVQMPR